MSSTQQQLLELLFLHFSGDRAGPHRCHAHSILALCAVARCEMRQRLLTYGWRCLSMAEAAMSRSLYNRAAEAERVQAQLAVLIRSNTEFRGSLEDRVRQLLGAHGVAAAVVEHLTTQHPELQAEISFERRRATFWLGVDALADDVEETEDENSDSEPEG